MKNNNKWFTLVEVIVSITIFSIMMISMISIYILSTDTSLKSDINRSMHENIKSVITEISEDIVKHGVSWVSNSVTDVCELSYTDNYKEWNELCWNSWNNYYLAKKNISWNYVRTDSLYCWIITNQCYIVKKNTLMWINAPLTNSLVSIKDLKFYVSSQNVNKVTVLIDLQPTLKAGVKSNLIKNNSIIFQTTISERLF